MNKDEMVGFEAWLDIRNDDFHTLVEAWSISAR